MNNRNYIQFNLPYSLLMQTEPTEISNRNRETHILFRFCCQIGRLCQQEALMIVDDRFNICQGSLCWKGV